MRVMTHIITEYAYRGFVVALTRSDSDLNLDLDTNATNSTMLSGCKTKNCIISMQQSDVHVVLISVCFASTCENQISAELIPQL